MLALYLKCYFTAQYTSIHCTHFSTPRLDFSRVDNYGQTLFYGRLGESAYSFTKFNPLNKETH